MKTLTEAQLYFIWQCVSSKKGLSQKQFSLWYTTQTRSGGSSQDETTKNSESQKSSPGHQLSPLQLASSPMPDWWKEAIKSQRAISIMSDPRLWGGGPWARKLSQSSGSSKESS